MSSRPSRSGLSAAVSDGDPMSTPQINRQLSSVAHQRTPSMAAPATPSRPTAASVANAVPAAASGSSVAEKPSKGSSEGPPVHISEGSIFYTHQRKPYTLFFNESYDLCDAPPPPTQMLAKLRGKYKANADDINKDPERKTQRQLEREAMGKDKPLDPMQEALAKDRPLSTAARSCVALFFYFAHETEKNKPILCTQATGFHVSPSRIVTAYHNLSRRPDGYAFVECLATRSPNANLLTLREREKFTVSVMDSLRSIDSKFKMPDEDPYARVPWNPSNDVLILGVDDPAHYSKHFLLPNTQPLGSKLRNVCALGYPIFLLHDRDILDSFPDLVTFEIEEELHPGIHERVAPPLPYTPNPPIPQRMAPFADKKSKPAPPTYPPGQEPPASSSESAVAVPSTPGSTATGTPAADGEDKFVGGTLTAIVHEAKDLYNATWFGRMEPYVRLTLSRKKGVEHRTKHCRLVGKKAIFELEHFPFSIKDRGLRIRIEVFNRNLLGPDDFVGRAYLSVDDILKNPQFSWYRLGRDSGEKTDAGEVAISFLFTPLDAVDQKSLQDMFKNSVLPPSALERLALFNAQLQLEPEPASANSLVYWHNKKALERAIQQAKHAAAERAQQQHELAMKQKEADQHVAQLASADPAAPAAGGPSSPRLTAAPSPAGPPPALLTPAQPNGSAPAAANGAAPTESKEPAFTEGTLTIVVTEARNLWDSQFLGKQDPYCMLTTPKNKELQYRTKVVKSGGRSAQFDREHFPFSVKEAGMKIKLEVYSKSTITADAFIGRVTLSVDDLIKSPQLTWYRIGRNAGERTDSGEVALAALFMPVDPDELPELPDIDYGQLELWAVHFLGDREAMKLKGQSPENVLKVINEKRKKDGFEMLEMPYTKVKPKFGPSDAFGVKGKHGRSNSITSLFDDKKGTASVESIAVRSVLRNLHRQFFFGYDRLLCSPGRMRWGEENDLDYLQHATVTLAKGMAGGPLVLTAQPKSFIGISLGGYARTSMNVLLSIFHPAFISLYQLYVVPSFLQQSPFAGGEDFDRSDPKSGSNSDPRLPVEVRNYLELVKRFGRLDPEDVLSTFPNLMLSGQASQKFLPDGMRPVASPSPPPPRSFITTPVPSSSPSPTAAPSAPSPVPEGAPLNQLAPLPVNQPAKAPAPSPTPVVPKASPAAAAPAPAPAPVVVAPVVAAPAPAPSPSPPPKAKEPTVKASASSTSVASATAAPAPALAPAPAPAPTSAPAASPAPVEAKQDKKKKQEPAAAAVPVPIPSPAPALSPVPVMSPPPAPADLDDIFGAPAPAPARAATLPKRDSKQSKAEPPVSTSPLPTEDHRGPRKPITREPSKVEPKPKEPTKPAPAPAPAPAPGPSFDFGSESEEEPEPAPAKPSTSTSKASLPPPAPSSGPTAFTDDVFGDALIQPRARPPINTQHDTNGSHSAADSEEDSPFAHGAGSADFFDAEEYHEDADSAPVSAREPAAAHAPTHAPAAKSGADFDDLFGDFASKHSSNAPPNARSIVDDDDPFGAPAGDFKPPANAHRGPAQQDDLDFI